MTLNPKNTTKFFDKLQRNLSKKSKYKCMFPDCEMTSIAAHSISKEFFLRNISENGKVYLPLPIRDDSATFKKIRLKLEGIDRVTTFNGFCLNHDNLFKNIDTNGISTYSDVLLQIYRSLNYEAFRNHAYQSAEVHADGSADIFNSENELNKTINSETLISLFHDLIDEFPESKTPLPVEDLFSLHPFSKKVESNIRILVRRLNFKCQVALHKKIQLRKNKEIYDSYIFVFPSPSCAMAMIICHPDDLPNFNNRLISDIDVLNFIESTMMLDSQWWINPSVVNIWSEDKLNFIEQDYWFFHERNLWDDYDVSIFDEVRRELCINAPEEIKLKELEKINNLPIRKDEISRRISYINKSIIDRNYRIGRV